MASPNASPETDPLALLGPVLTACIAACYLFANVIPAGFRPRPVDLLAAAIVLDVVQCFDHGGVNALLRSVVPQQDPASDFRFPCFTVGMSLAVLAASARSSVDIRTALAETAVLLGTSSLWLLGLVPSKVGSDHVDGPASRCDPRPLIAVFGFAFPVQQVAARFAVLRPPMQCLQGLLLSWGFFLLVLSPAQNSPGSLALSAPQPGPLISWTLVASAMYYRLSWAQDAKRENKDASPQSSPVAELCTSQVIRRVRGEHLSLTQGGTNHPPFQPPRPMQSQVLPKARSEAAPETRHIRGDTASSMNSLGIESDEVSSPQASNGDHGEFRSSSPPA